MLTNLPVRDRPPWHFRLAKWMIRNRIRGGYRLVELAESLGWLNHLVRYRLAGGVSLDVPLNRRENQWAEPDLLAYERPLVELLAERIAALPPPVTWIDCGADIGSLTALVLARLRGAGVSPAISEIIAIEPNADVTDLLEQNLSLLPSPSRVVAAAVADFAGRGRLDDSPTLRSAHGQFLVPDERGKVDVTRLDDLSIPLGRSLAIKIDVEGGELAALRGARQLLTQAPAWVVSFEAHRAVVQRTGIDPCDCLRFMFELGATGAVVAEAPQVKLDPQWPYFDQVREPPISNVVCWKPEGR